MFSNAYFQEIRQEFDRQMTLLDGEIRRLETGAADGTAANEEAGARDGALSGLSDAVLTGGLAGLRLAMLREKKQEIETVLGQCGEDEAQAMTFLYSAMPLSDLLDYPAELFLAYARHGIFLWKEGPFAGKIPERLFANYVLHHRVNNEDIADTRPFFYEKVIGRVQPENMERTIVEANYWCAQEGTYRSTDGRTQNARTMYHTATGRCGEESTFAVTVLRSIGIPARQVYAPLWTHCDDNHAWVEAWCDGKWIFFGACEPEERLNYGWFIGPSSRAMLLHSRWFGPDEPLDPVLGRKGMSRILNHMERYAETTWLTIRVEEENGRPVPDAKVECQVVNAGELRPIAFLRTAGAGAEEETGTVRMLTGYGDLYVAASAELPEPEKTTAEGCGSGSHTWYGEAKVSMIGLKPGEKGEVTVVLHREPECGNSFRDLEFYAPKLGNKNDDTLTAEQKAIGLARNQECAEYRARKKESFYDAEAAGQALAGFAEPDRGELDGLLHNSLGNLPEILAFLSWDSDCLAAQDRQAAETAERPGHWKLEVLKALREKDLWDIKAETLQECCESAAPYAGTMPDEVFYRFLVNPRVANEMVRPCRRFLENGLSREQTEAVRQNPAVLPALTERWIRSIPSQEYEDLVTSALGCLRGGIGSAMSKMVFCVTLYRVMGIPARIRMIDHSVEYYQDGSFRPTKTQDGPKAGLTLCGNDALHLTDWAHYSLDRFEKDWYRRVGMWEHFRELQQNRVHLELEPGIYRLLTSNRRADGSQLVKTMTFELHAGEERTEELSLREISPTALRTEYGVRDLQLKTPEGETAQLKDLSGSGKALLVWLEVTREPTEHILNELYDKSAEFSALSVPLYVVVKSAEELEDRTLKRTLEAIPNICPLFHDFGEDYKALAEEIGLTPGRLPMAMVLEAGLTSVYGDAGYNVGLADMLYRVLSA